MPRSSGPIPEPTVRWPLVSADRSNENIAETLFARAFGTRPHDLDVDFGLPKPYVVTALLAACLVAPDASLISRDTLWNWTVPKRTQALLAIATATNGAFRQQIVRCPSPACGETMELALDLNVFRQSCEQSFEFQPNDGPAFQVRVPTGSDQLQYVYEPDAGSLAIVEGLVVSDFVKPFDETWLAQLESELEQRDPLTAAALFVHCPYCGLDNAIDFDLEEHLLRDFERAQYRMLDKIHRLASAYHWTESEILALPSNRRDYYLGRVGEEWNS